jgi:hypothetical protein
LQGRFKEIDHPETRIAYGSRVYLVGRSSIKTAHFVSIHLQTWPPQAIIDSDWPISKKSSPLKPLG